MERDNTQQNKQLDLQLQKALIQEFELSNRRLGAYISALAELQHNILIIPSVSSQQQDEFDLNEKPAQQCPQSTAMLQQDSYSVGLPSLNTTFPPSFVQATPFTNIPTSGLQHVTLSDRANEDNVIIENSCLHENPVEKQVKDENKNQKKKTLTETKPVIVSASHQQTSNLHNLSYKKGENMDEKGKVIL